MDGADSPRGPESVGPESVSSESVLVECRAPIRIVTLNRPDKRNAADRDMQRRLLDTWRAIRDDGTVRAVVVTGAGSAFCAGGDFSVLGKVASGSDADLQQELGAINRESLRLLLELPVAVIAAVNGPAIGFGAALAALCDVVVMGEDAFISEPHVKYGLPPSPACELVWPYLTSRAVAKELMMTGRRVDAGEALRIGLANRVCPSGQEMTVALEMAEELAGLPERGVTATKAALNRILIENLPAPD